MIDQVKNMSLNQLLELKEEIDNTIARTAREEIIDFLTRTKCEYNTLYVAETFRSETKQIAWTIEYLDPFLKNNDEQYLNDLKFYSSNLEKHIDVLVDCYQKQADNNKIEVFDAIIIFKEKGEWVFKTRKDYQDYYG